MHTRRRRPVPEDVPLVESDEREPGRAACLFFAAVVFITGTIVLHSFIAHVVWAAVFGD